MWYKGNREGQKWPWEKSFKRCNWYGERPRGEQKRDIHGEKGVAALSLMDRCNQRRRRICNV